MTVSKTSICNMALAHCAISKTVSDYAATTTSPEAGRCNQFYEHCRDLLLEAREWAFANRRVTLQNLGTPPDEWEYRYLYPDNCKRVNGIVLPGAQLVENEHDIIPFRVVGRADGYGKAILCDLEDAEIEYNHLIEDETLFSTHFVEVLALLLASRIAVPLKVDANLAARLEQRASVWLSEAQANNKTERKDPVTRKSQYALARG